MIYGDYHTHTTYSHGKGSVEENVLAARARGLKEIAVTDHGLRHILYKLKRKHIARLRAEVDALNAKYSDIRVLMGIEANLIGRGGVLDLTAEEARLFDIVLAGYHITVRAQNCREQHRFLIGNFLAHNIWGYSKSRVKSNTRAYIQAIEKNPIAVVTHINFRIKADAAEVAKAARDHGTLIEISGKRTGCTDDEICAMAATGAQFILSSDAHRTQKVGDVAFAEDILARTGIPYTQVANWDKRPVFRTPKGEGL